MSEPDVTLDWPGVFATWFRKQPIAPDEGWLRFAFHNAEWIRRGPSGHTVRLTLPAEEAEDVLSTVEDYMRRWQHEVRATSGNFVPRRTRIALRQYMQRTRDQLNDPFRTHPT